jgi:cytochrome P450
MFSAQRDCSLPLSSPITAKDGRLLDSITLQKGDVIIVSTLNCNRDPAIWGADAEDWKPERWLSPLPESVSENKVPGIYSNL